MISPRNLYLSPRQRLDLVTYSLRLQRKLPRDCPPKTATAQTAASPALTAQTPAAPRVGSVYIAPVDSNTNTCTNQTFTSFISLGFPDDFTHGTRSECGNGFAGGAAIGMPVATVPNPFANVFRIAETTPPRPRDRVFSRWGNYSPIVLGVEATLLGSTAKNTFTGSPVPVVGPGPETDTYTAKDNLMMSFTGTATIPTGAGFNLVVNAGYGMVNKTIAYNCNGFCTTAAGIPARSSSTNVWLSGGPVVGAGIQVAVPNLPFIVQFDYSRWFIAERNISLGDPADVQAGFRAGQDINLFAAKAVIPLGGAMAR
jgi:hypothetical protein